MNFADYQRAAARTARMDTAGVIERLKLNPEYLPLLNFSLGLGGETGEVEDEVKKAVFHGHPLNVEAIKKELGDVLWYWSQVANVLGFDTEAIAVANVAKLMARYPEGFSEAASIARVDVEASEELGTPPKCGTCHDRRMVPMGPALRGLKPCPQCNR